MPTYQYACTECGYQFEAVQSFSDESLTMCPECGGTLRKLYSAVGVVFKGSGFYRTDSRKAESGKTSSTLAPTNASSSTGGTGDKDSKGATTPAPDTSTSSAKSTKVPTAT